MTGLNCRIAVAVVTKGRAAILANVIGDIDMQTRAPDRIFVCHTEPEDVVGVSPSTRTEFILACPGSSVQRNAVLQAADDCDIVLFLDDDFMMAPRYVETTIAALQADPDIVVTTGHVIADGAKGPGLDPTQGRAILAADIPGTAFELIDAYNGYGCNMAIRMSVVRKHGIRFDEKLPLYGWYEDIDFTRRLARHGRIVLLRGARGVHLGTKLARTSGRRLGYSQVVNPVYLARKGSYDWSRALKSIGRHVCANLARALYPEPYVDRLGRLGGNLWGLFDLTIGTADPEHILKM